MKYEPFAIQVLNDARIYLNRIAEEDYRSAIPLLAGSTIGQHTRHFIEFFQCLIEQSRADDKVINYDRRKRNKNIEDFPGIALTAIDDIITYLQAESQPCTLAVEASYEGDETIRTNSCFDRELMYNIEHAIHHLAIIKIGLQIQTPHIKVPAHFGVAASTVKYRKAVEQGANKRLETN